MDLSKVKWIFIIGIPVLIIFLFSGPGVNYIYNNATDATPGADAAQDAADEQKLSTWGGYLLSMFRYQQAEKFYSTAIARYPEGKNVYMNYYNRARAYEKMGEFKKAADDLFLLFQFNADSLDERVPENNILKLRIAKLIEIHNLNPQSYPGIE